MSPDTIREPEVSLRIDRLLGNLQVEGLIEEELLLVTGVVSLQAEEDLLPQGEEVTLALGDTTDLQEDDIINHQISSMTIAIRMPTNIGPQVGPLEDPPPGVEGGHLPQVLVEAMDLVLTPQVVANGPNFRNVRVGGRLSMFTRNWSRDSWAFKIVKKGLTWKWCLPPPPFNPFFPTSDRGTEYIGKRSLRSRGHRAYFISGISRSPVFGSKKELFQKESNIRPVDPESIHILPIIQDDHDTGREECSSGRSLYHVHRPKRCLLARSNSPIFPKVPRIQDREEEISFQSPPFRSEPCPKGFSQNFARQF